MEGGAGGEAGSCDLCFPVCSKQSIALYLYCCLMELHSSAFPPIMKNSCWLLYVWYCFTVQPPRVKPEISIRVGCWLGMFDTTANRYSTWVLRLIPKWYFVSPLPWGINMFFSTNLLSQLVTSSRVTSCVDWSQERTSKPTRPRS